MFLQWLARTRRRTLIGRGVVGPCASVLAGSLIIRSTEDLNTEPPSKFDQPGLIVKNEAIVKAYEVIYLPLSSVITN